MEKNSSGMNLSPLHVDIELNNKVDCLTPKLGRSISYPANIYPPHLTENDKGLYATMKRWRIDPSFVAWGGYPLPYKIRESKFSRNFSPVFFAFSK